MALKEIIYKDKKFKLSYEIINSDKKIDILILHGWGSNKEIMKQAFGNELNIYRQIYLDLPGFGNSSNDMILTTKDYANIVSLFIKEIKINPIATIGHSFGGKVATLLNPKNLILLSSAGIKTKKPWLVKVKITTFKILKPLGFGKIRELFVSSDAKGMSHEMYETFKNVVDEDFREEFTKYRGKALLFWGEEDTATPLYTGKIVASLIKNSHFYPLSGDHFFFLKHAKFISNKIKSKVNLE